MGSDVTQLFFLICPAFFFSSRGRHTRWPRDWSSTCALPISPAVGELGLVEDILCDRAFEPRRRTDAAPLAALGDLAHLAPGPDGEVPGHVVSNALAAAALDRKSVV